MPVRRTADIETFGIGELRGVAVGGADAQRHRRARRHRDAAEFERLDGHAVAELVGALEPQHFLDRGLDQRGILDQPPLLAAWLRQRHQAVADQIGGGLVAGIEQEDAVVQQLLFGQPLAIVFALNEPGQHVAVGIAGPGPSPRHQPFEVRQEVLHRLVAAGEGVRADHRLQRAEDGQRPVAQGLALVLGHVEQIADHLDRDRGGEIVDQVHLAPLAAMASRRRSTSRIRSGSMPAIARGESAPMIRRRTRVWAGGSLKTRLVVWCS